MSVPIESHRAIIESRRAENPNEVISIRAKIVVPNRSYILVDPQNNREYTLRGLWSGHGFIPFEPYKHPSGRSIQLEIDYGQIVEDCVVRPQTIFTDNQLVYRLYSPAENENSVYQELNARFSSQILSPQKRFCFERTWMDATPLQ